MKEVAQKIWSYLNFFKKQEAPGDEPMSLNLKAMHTINKISILMFCVALIIIFVKFVIL